MTATWEIRQGDALERLREMPDASVQCCVTSPPYFGLRDYGHAGQIGLEPTPDEFVVALVAVFREVRRVLRDDGTLWLNLGDSYAGSGKGPSNDRPRPHAAMDNVAAAPNRWVSIPQGVKGKDLLGVPWMVAFALRADGWYLRSDIIWHKPNPMPESVTDRPTSAHEHVFLLAKSARYFFDADAIREDASSHLRQNSFRGDWGPKAEQIDRAWHGPPKDRYDQPNRNKRNVWTVATHPYPEAHFATFPQKLIEPCVLAGSRPGDTILDSFCGSGTTGVVALRHDRSFIGIELNSKYAEMARGRIRGDAPLFNVTAEVAAWAFAKRGSTNRDRRSSGLAQADSGAHPRCGGGRDSGCDGSVCRQSSGA